MPALPLQHLKTEPRNLSTHNTWFFKQNITPKQNVTPKCGVLKKSNIG